MMHFLVQRIQCALLINIMFFLSATATVVITHEKAPEGATLPFAVTTHAINTTGTFLFMGGTSRAHDAVSLAGCSLQEGAFFLAQQKEKVIINNITDIPNPLLGASVRHLALLPTPDMFSRNTENPVMVTEEFPHTVFLINSGAGNNSMLATPVKDAHGQLYTGGITSIAAAGSQNFGFVFAAVKPGIDYSKQPVVDTHFGDVGSGIAFIKLIKDKVKIQKTDKELEEERAKKTGDSPIEETKVVEMYFLGNMNAQADANQTGPAGDTLKENTTDKQGATKENQSLAFKARAAALDKTSPILKSGNDLTAVEVTDMHWDTYLGQVYIATRAVTGPAHTDGVCALIVGYVDQNDKLILRPFAPLSTLQGDNGLVTTQGSYQEICLHKVRTMLTSTWLSYAITVGGNGSASQTKRTVCALPIVLGEKDHGTLAACDDAVEELFGQKEGVYHFQGRRHKTGAVRSKHVHTRTKSIHNMPAFVGNGDAPGDITDLIIVGDTVVVTCAGGTSAECGAFFSHALFDAQGKIKAWTAWKRMLGQVDPLYAGGFFAPTHSFIGLTGSDAQHANTLKKTTWMGLPEEQTSTENVEKQSHEQPKHLADIIHAEFSAEQGGVHGFFDFSSIIKGDQFLLTTGLQKLMIIAGKGTSNTTVVFDDAVLKELGSITAAELVQVHHQNYLVVGGAGGVALLCDEHGNGFIPERAANLNDLRHMKFKKIGAYSTVRKIMRDGEYLFVLTDKTLDRFAVGTIATNAPDKIVCAYVQPESRLVVSFKDFIVSDKLAVIATSRGLWRLANSYDISDPLFTPHGQPWVPVEIPQGFDSVAQLCAISVTGRPQDIARYAGGMLYVVDGSIGNNQSRLHRFTVKSTENDVIHAETIQPINDCYQGKTATQALQTYFMNLGNYMHLCSYSGPALLLARNKHGKQTAAVQGLPYDVNVPVGIRSSMIKYHVGSAAALKIKIENAHTITTIARNNVDGSTIVGGNFGIRIHG